MTTTQTHFRRDRTWRPSTVQPQSAPLPIHAPAPAAVLVLAGGLRPSPLSAECGRSVLDLPLTRSHTVLTYWLARFAELCSGANPAPAVRIIHNQHTPAPTLPSDAPLAEITTERETKEYRGPAGVAKDACERYPADATILIVEGARCITASLASLLHEHAASGAAVTVGCNLDRSPAGVYAVRRSALDLIPGGGFMDLKEQWLSRVIAAGLPVHVHALSSGLALPMRTLEQFIAAVGHVNGWAESSVHLDESTGQCDRVRTEHTVLSPNAVVGEGAVLIDSVVMPGATIGRGAIVARSLVCDGAVIPAGAQIVGSVVVGRGTARVTVQKRGFSKAHA